MARTRKPKSVKANCDRLARKVIHLRDEVCQRCGGSVNLQCAHVKGRKYNVTRWDLLNLLLLCSCDPSTGHEGCHEWFDKHIILGQRWFEETYPVRADHLADVERNWELRLKTWKLKDFLKVEDYLKDKIKDLSE